MRKNFQPKINETQNTAETLKKKIEITNASIDLNQNHKQILNKNNTNNQVELELEWNVIDREWSLSNKKINNVKSESANKTGKVEKIIFKVFILFI
jgi:hypothetical protein